MRVRTSPDFLLSSLLSAVAKQVIAATNRVDILDPALLRSGRIDRKIEFPLPNEEARARILVIHSRKMSCSKSLSLLLLLLHPHLLFGF